MQLMVNTLNRQQQQAAATELGGGDNKRIVLDDPAAAATTTAKDPIADMVVACCRFLCYFCRTGSKNQSAVFEYLSYLLEKSCMLLCKCNRVPCSITTTREKLHACSIVCVPSR